MLCATKWKSDKTMHRWKKIFENYISSKEFPSRLYNELLQSNRKQVSQIKIGRIFVKRAFQRRYGKGK